MAGTKHAGTILITGIAGSLAQLCAQKLAEQGYEIVGVDYRPRPLNLVSDIKFYRANYNKRLIEDIFRRHLPQKVLHLGRVGNLKSDRLKRFDLNVVGSAKIMELCLKHRVQRLVVLSTFHIYGAHPHNPIPISEDDPLRAALRFPQLSDAVQLDNLATTWIYRNRATRSVILRPCNIIGPNIRNAISSYLRQSHLNYLLGFNPMWQFIHQTDMVRALLLASASDTIGVYNVAGGPSVPVAQAFSWSQGLVTPIPSSLASLLLRLRRHSSIPPYFLDFLKYPCVIVDTAFQKKFGYQAEIGTQEAIQSSAGVSSKVSEG
jgi:UDP-glucose 4-epimerase